MNSALIWQKFRTFEQQDYLIKIYSWPFGNNEKIGFNNCKEMHFNTGMQLSQGIKVQLTKKKVNATIEGLGKYKQEILKSLKRFVNLNLLQHITKQCK